MKLVQPLQLAPVLEQIENTLLCAFEHNGKARLNALVGFASSIINNLPSAFKEILGK